MITPWGDATYSRTIAPGITWYDTPGHGGYLLSPARRAAMPEPVRDFQTFAGGDWYEEDCDAALVVLSFPDVYPVPARELAREFVASWRPELLPEVAA